MVYSRGQLLEVLWHHLLLYFLLCFVDAIGLSFNNMSQGCWLFEIITRFLHQFICIWVKSIVGVYLWQINLFLKQALRRNEAKERSSSHFALACFMSWKRTFIFEDMPIGLVKFADRPSCAFASYTFTKWWFTILVVGSGNVPKYWHYTSCSDNSLLKEGRHSYLATFLPTLLLLFNLIISATFDVTCVSSPLLDPFLPVDMTPGIASFKIASSSKNLTYVK